MAFRLSESLSLRAIGPDYASLVSPSPSAARASDSVAGLIDTLWLFAPAQIKSNVVANSLSYSRIHKHVTGRGPGPGSVRGAMQSEHFSSRSDAKDCPPASAVN